LPNWSGRGWTAPILTSPSASGGPAAAADPSGGGRRLHERDLADGFGRVYLPHALERKYPHADREWGWQYVFPAATRRRDPRSRVLRRHPLQETVIQRAVKEAVRRARLTKPATPHTFRHAFATHRSEDGYDIRTVQELLGHARVGTTRGSTQVLNRGGRAVRSPADRLEGRVQPHTAVFGCGRCSRTREGSQVRLQEPLGLRC
jgi:hypothetical protein